MGSFQRGALAVAAAVVVALATPAYLSTAAVARGGTEAATSSAGALRELDSAARLNPFSTEPLLLRSRSCSSTGIAGRARCCPRRDGSCASELGSVGRAGPGCASRGSSEEARVARLRAKALNPRTVQLRG